jgi:hypothetical protein
VLCLSCIWNDDVAVLAMIDDSPDKAKLECIYGHSLILLVAHLVVVVLLSQTSMMHSWVKCQLCHKSVLISATSNWVIFSFWVSVLLIFHFVDLKVGAAAAGICNWHGFFWDGLESEELGVVGLGEYAADRK